MSERASPARPGTAAVRRYWNEHIHDLEITRHPVGSTGFFADLDEYHFDKLHHLLRLIDFAGQSGRRVLDVGCGAGVDLVRFARGGAIVTGVDLAESAVSLARLHASHQSVPATFCVGDGERLPFAAGTFDFVYAHGVIQYTPGHQAIIDECRRVLKPGGTAFFQAYNRVSWLNVLSRVMHVGLEHEGAPVLVKFSPREFRRLLHGFARVQIIPERFPVKSRLHGGWKGALYNGVFVRIFNAVPRRLVRRFGWHLLAFCHK
ncbi:MAG: class I SAM-dependent methyltransferase [Acidobacteriota bacterium]